jgi:hypothetical protein
VAKKQMFSMEAMEQVAGFMQIKPSDGTNFSQIGSNASAILENTHTTTGQQSLRLVTSAEVESNLSQACQEFQRLCMRLWEMSPDYKIFSKTAFTENALECSLFGSNKSATLLRLYKATKSNSTCLIICINEIKQSLQYKQSTGHPLPSGSTVPPQTQVLDSQKGHGGGMVQGL